MIIAAMRKVVSWPSCSQIVYFAAAREPRGEPAEGVGKGRPLWHGGQRHPRERHANRHANRHRDEDPGVVDNLGVQQRPDDRGNHPGDAGRHAAPRGLRMVQPPQRQDEQRGGGQVAGLRQMLGRFTGSAPAPLNIFSMRSVMRKPLTMLVVEAATATAPSTVLRKVLLFTGDDNRARTTAMAEMALVNDISGVCSSRDTFWMTWISTKVAHIEHERHGPQIKLMLHGSPGPRRRWKTTTGQSRIVVQECGKSE